ncbi:alpha/beta fold hydrolase [Halomonas beimenensis]|uniref:AB hydrolase-1 domain-containing protein n=1 Tax=Halomonas beimenensis TaxID=475662 RepID=A0A291P548_9GAMM|nr:alpha/beta hydrolase [Halomonas beimenensis]ATJ82007.1 hypothetical protein BEI_1020 [Halomonas beimenensis]
MKGDSTKKIQLHDGRHLAYIERGNPDGVPVLFFHGTPGSRHFRHPDGSIATRKDVRVIHPDRPAIGLSDPKPGRTLLDWAEDTGELLDALQIDKCTIAGISGGGPYALACAWAMPDRVSRIAVISGMAPLEMPGATEGMSTVNRTGLWIARHASWLLPLAISPMAQGARKEPRKVLDKAATSYSAPDKKLMERPEIRGMYAEDIAESYRQGARGHARDLRAVAKPWGFNLGEIRIPVTLWQGELDRNITTAMAMHMKEKIPDAKLNLIKDQGHLLLFEYWEDILSELIDG